MYWRTKQWSSHSRRKREAHIWWVSTQRWGWEYVQNKEAFAENINGQSPFLSPIHKTMPSATESLNCCLWKGCCWTGNVKILSPLNSLVINHVVRLCIDAHIVQHIDMCEQWLINKIIVNRVVHQYEDLFAKFAKSAAGLQSSLEVLLCVVLPLNSHVNKMCKNILEREFGAL